MHQRIKCNVDFTEAVKDYSNIFMYWMEDQPTCTYAFIPNHKDQDVCVEALHMHSYAADEAHQMPLEYCDTFGDEGPYANNEIIYLIGKREKKCLPFVNLSIYFGPKIAVFVEFFCGE